MRILYNTSIHLYHLIIIIASLLNSKAKKWVVGRKNIFQEIEKKIKLFSPNSKIIWFHCASLGEFEQGRPLIEKIKEQNSNVKILLTFFSPSGYEIRKNYSEADIICYLPIDTPSNAKRFVSLIKPDAAFFVKYEFWFNYLNELKKKNIKTYLVSGIFRNQQHFFKWYGTWFKKQLSCFTHFFVQDENSKKLINAIQYSNATISGDTRFDRVFEIAQNVKHFDLVKTFCDNNKTLIAGSAWKEDVEIISNWYNSQPQTKSLSSRQAGYKLIIATHEIDENTIQSTIRKFNNSTIVRYSQAKEQHIKHAQILIIDNIGILSSLYQYGTIAFIGGGFGKGIHNILEAATFGLPVIFGPNYEKFSEAKELLHLKGAFAINNNIDFENAMNHLSNETELQKASSASKNYVSAKIGATQLILNTIKL